jgi:cytochrome c oxidase subunit 4
MSSASTEMRHEEHHGAVTDEPGSHAHPTDNVYLIVALVLGVLTATEVGLYYLKGGAVNTVALLVLMIIKFVIVAGFFMHLRFDNRLFRRLFAMGLGMAVFVYTVVLFTFGIFHI